MAADTWAKLLWSCARKMRQSAMSGGGWLEAAAGGNGNLVVAAAAEAAAAAAPPATDFAGRPIFLPLGAYFRAGLCCSSLKPKVSENKRENKRHEQRDRILRGKAWRAAKDKQYHRKGTVNMNDPGLPGALQYAPM